FQITHCLAQTQEDLLVGQLQEFLSCLAADILHQTTGIDGAAREADSQAATIDQGGVVLWPVADAVSIVWER
ncbi:MAG: hypothetical protein H7835_20960, partial [Magnetococcus sp. XQGC-1]